MKDRITLPLLRRLEPEDREYFVWDIGLPGFGVRMKPNGACSFTVQYKTPDGRTRRKALGKVGSPGSPTLDQARKAAEKLLAQHTLGADPIGQERERREALTVKQLCEEYIAEARAGRILNRSRRPKAKSTLDIDEGRIKAHVLPLLGRRRVDELTAQDIAKFGRSVEAGKTARDEASGKLRGRTVVKGGAGTARRTLGLLGGILTYAVAQGYRADNPARAVQRTADGKRSLGEVPEIYAALGRALRRAEDSGEDWRPIALLRLIALTGMRRQEAVNLQWQEIRRSSGTVILGRTKTGESARPLARAAIELLATLPGAWGTGFCFPAPRSPGAAYGGLPGAWDRIRTHLDLSPEDRSTLGVVTLHHLRHAAATTAHEIGLSMPTVGAILGHAAGGVTAGYVHLVDHALKAAADRLGDAIAQHVELSFTVSKQVVQFPRSP